MLVSHSLGWKACEWLFTDEVVHACIVAVGKRGSWQRLVPFRAEVPFLVGKEGLVGLTRGKFWVSLSAFGSNLTQPGVVLG
jgi:hypothetical protein